MTAERTTEKTRPLFDETTRLVGSLYDNRPAGLESLRLATAQLSPKCDLVVFGYGDGELTGIRVYRNGSKRISDLDPTSEYCQLVKSNYEEPAANTLELLNQTMGVVNNSGIGKTESGLKLAAEILYTKNRKLPVIIRGNSCGVIAFGDIPAQTYEIDDNGGIVREEKVIFRSALIVPTKRIRSESGDCKKGGKSDGDREQLFGFKPINPRHYIKVIHSAIGRIDEEQGSEKANMFLQSFLKKLRGRDLHLADDIEASFRNLSK